MDWQMIGAIGEILGSVGVIATLLYVGRQIHLAEVAAQREGAAELLGAAQTVFSQISESVESARIWRMGMSSDPALTVDELAKFHMVLYQIMLLWERLHYLGESGSMEGWFFQHFQNSRCEVIAAPGFQAWWEVRGHWFTESFRQMVASERARASRPYTPMGVEVGRSEVADRASV